MGAGFGRFRTLIVRVIHDETPGREAIVAQDHPHTGHQEFIPGNLAVAEHPGQGRQRIGAEAGAFKAGPADRVGQDNRRNTKRQPGPLHSGHAVVGLMRPNRAVHGVNKGAHKGGRFSHNHRRLQASGAQQAH